MIQFGLRLHDAEKLPLDRSSLRPEKISDVSDGFSGVIEQAESATHTLNKKRLHLIYIAMAHPFQP